MYKNSVRKKVLPLLLSAALLFGSAPLSASAHTSKTEAIKTVKINLSNVNSDGGDGYTYDGDTVTIKDSGFSYEITGSTSSNKIAVSADSEASHVNITLDGAKIDVSSSDDSCAFKLNNKSVVNLTLKGANTLKSGKDCAGLQAPDGTELTVTRGSTGSLGATGGSDGAGIGGGNRGSGGTVTISGGTVSANGGDHSAGFGGGGDDCGGSGGTITINGGTVSANGNDGAGIGGGRWSSNGGSITINGGTVSATSFYGAGIGGGRWSNNVGSITINGGTVTANGNCGAGIGGGVGSGNGGSITINGGTVTANGNYGAGIGGGIGGSGNSITISGGTVSATGGSDSAGIGAGGNCDDNGSCTITGGSVNAVNGDGTAPGIPSGVTDGSGNTEYLTKVTVGKDAVMSKSMAYTADGGDKISTSSDEKGLLYLWLTKGEHILAVTAAGKPYSALFSVSDTEKNNVTAILDSERKADIDISNVDSKGGNGYTYADNTVTIRLPGDYTFTGSTSSNKIVVNAGTEVSPINITLDGAKIDVSSYGDSCAFKLNDKSVVNLTLKGVNTLESGKDCAGLQAPDGTELTVTKGSTGSLNASGGGAGIGDTASHGGKITINGGTVTAAGGVFIHNMSIGGAGIDGTITINGGTVTATSDIGSAGIGGGSVTINGGNVTATGSSNIEFSGAGIGGGNGGNGGSVTISGGTVTATGSDYGAGIGGGGEQGNGGNVTINGGNVTADGGALGAGIGGGDDGIGGSVTINGGTVSATGGGTGAGIGSGSFGNGGTITINGGTVMAKSKTYIENGVYYSGAGIGSGVGGSGGSVTINGGTVTAKGGYYSAGIGGGSSGDGGYGRSGEGGNVTISGGTVTAKGGSGAAGIGAGKGNTVSGSCVITGGSVNAVNGDGTAPDIPSGVTDGSGNAEYLDTVTIENASGRLFSSRILEYIAVKNGLGVNLYKDGRIMTSKNTAKGSGITVSTDTAGKLYLWLPAGNAKLSFTSGKTSANVSGLVGTDNKTAMTARLHEQSSGSDSTDSNSSEPAANTALPSVLTDTATGVAADLSDAVFPSGVTGVSFAAVQETAVGMQVTKGASGAPDTQGAAVYNFAVSDSALNIIGAPLLYNLKLIGKGGSAVTAFTGEVTVRIPLPMGLRGTPRIFRYEESTKTFTDMKAKIENGYLVFETDHFSYYVLAGTGDSITLDTLNYTMPANGKYQIGLKITGSKTSYVKFYSTNNKTAAAVKLKNGNYEITGKNHGTAYIMFDVYDDKNNLLTHASVRVDVKNGVKPHGNFQRQYGIY